MYAEDLPYWKTSSSSPDAWLTKAPGQVAGSQRGMVVGLDGSIRTGVGLSTEVTTGRMDGMERVHWRDIGRRADSLV